jgi:hypothetical protein
MQEKWKRELVKATMPNLSSCTLASAMLGFITMLCILVPLPESEALPSVGFFAECLFGHSAKKALPRAALGKVRLSAKRLFTECWTLGRGQHSAKTGLPSVKHSAKGALGKEPSAAVPKLTVVSLCRVPTVGSRQRGFFAECHIVDTRQSKLCRVSSLDTQQNIFLFF